MKYFISALLTLCSVNCVIHGDEHNSVFLQNFKDESDLLRNGYTKPKLDTNMDSAIFDERTRRDYLEFQRARAANYLVNQIGDTNVCYRIKNGKTNAISIIISVKHADTARLFAFLDTLGFLRTIKSDGHYSLFENSKAGLSYMMNINSSRIEFVNDFGKPNKQPRILPMDSTSQDRKN